MNEKHPSIQRLQQILDGIISYIIITNRSQKNSLCVITESSNRIGIDHINLSLLNGTNKNEKKSKGENDS